jgi:hypothetical protein
MSRYNYLISTQELKTQVDDLRRMVHVLLAEKEEAERKAASKAESDQRLERAGPGSSTIVPLHLSPSSRRRGHQQQAVVAAAKV